MQTKCLVKSTNEKIGEEVSCIIQGADKRDDIITYVSNEKSYARREQLHAEFFHVAESCRITITNIGDNRRIVNFVEEWILVDEHRLQENLGGQERRFTTRSTAATSVSGVLAATSC